MGLDIYFLTRTKKQKNIKNASSDKRDITFEVENTQILKEILYYRKINWLIPQFEYHDKNGNIYNCKYIKISKRQVSSLLKKCYNIINTYSKNHTIDETILPTQSGFFFGNVDYDENYIEQIKKVWNDFNDIYTKIDFNKYDILMYCSW